MKRVGWNHYFLNMRATGAPVKIHRDPVTRLCSGSVFKRIIILYVHCIHGDGIYILIFFSKFLCYRTKGFLVPFMSTHNTPFIFQVFFNNTSGTRYCYCWTAVKTPNIIVIIQNHLPLKKTYFTWFSYDCSNCPF